MIFSNKYIDYSKKTKIELYLTLILFLVLSNKTIVSIGKKLLHLSLAIKLPILGIIKKTVFNHFCGGENINQSKKTIKKLGENNIKTILDYSVEGQDDETSFQNTFNEIIKNIEEAECNKLVPFCVFKMTGIAEFKLLNKVNNKDKLSEKEMVDFQLLNTRLDLICEKAKKNKIPILIDAEESWIQDTIDQLTEAMMKKYNKYEVIIYNTIQLYRSDRLKYLIDLHKKAKKEKYKLGFKLVRGAYMEKERNRAKINNYKSPINISKKKSDEDFNKAAKYCIENIDMINICFGTHNEESTKMIIDLMSEKKIKNNDYRIYFSQLLGMSDNISFYLGYYNYNVAKYVPYGPVKEVLPYLIRRAEENSSIAGQTNREITRMRELIKKYSNHTD